MTVHQKIMDSLSTLTPAQRRMAQYVIESSESTALMTAKELAQATGTSDAAVIRFAQALGYTGFSDMRDNLRSSLLLKAGASGMQRELAALDGDTSIRSRIFDIEASAIKKTETLNSDELATRVVDQMIQADRVWVTGHGSTYPLAAYFAMHFNQVMGKAETLVIGAGDVAEKICQIKKGDVLIGIGYMRYLPYTVEIMKAAAAVGAHITAVTDTPSSPLAQVAENTFLVARTTDSMLWWSQAGTFAIADWLTALFMIRDSENVSERLRQADKAWQLLNHWHHDNERFSLARLQSTNNPSQP